MMRLPNAPRKRGCRLSPAELGWRPAQFNRLTARVKANAMAVSANDCPAIISLAHRVIGMVSVGGKATALVKAPYR